MSQAQNSSLWRRLFWPLATVGISAFALLFVVAPLVERFLYHQVNASITREAEAKAFAWAADFVVNVPEIKSVIETGRASPEQGGRIRQSIAVGDVFRFKLFRPNGELTFISDEAQFHREGGIAHTQAALEVYRTGETDISVHDGREKPNRPDTYVEAYIPAIGPRGDTIGVIEVYVDATALHTVLSQSYARMSKWLILGCAFVFLTPALAMIWRTGQLRLRDRRLAELQRFDQLTGVLNRNALTQKIDRSFVERGADEPIGVLFIDVDRFKRTNDAFGHQVGDEMLRAVAWAIQSSIRAEKDTVGRYGGDEFLVLCRATERAGLRAIVTRIVEALRKAETTLPDGVAPTLSIGAHVSHPGEDQQQALRAADTAVYEAKRRGRDQMVEYTLELEAEKNRSDEIRVLLTDAVEEARFELRFQPIFATANKDLIGLEALLRLRDRNGVLVSPGEFIPIAETTGGMGAIGEWVLGRALDVAQDWPEHLFVSVNLSIAQFEPGDLPRKVDAALAARGFNPARLELEITESMLIDERHQVWDQLRRIRQTGVRLSIDDFGAGNTSVAHFWKFKFDKIKLDRSFLQAREYDAAQYEALLRALVSFSKDLGLEITAEGVEFEDEFEANHSAGVDQVQGFLLGEPLPVENLPALIAASRETSRQAS